MTTSLHSMPVELLIEIIKLAAKGSNRLAFCHINRAMRWAALSAPDIWRNLRSVCTVYVSIDGPLIPKSYCEFISFWCDRVKTMNTFSVNFEMYFVKTPMKSEWISLDGPPLWMIIRLLTRARYLRTESTTLAYLRWRVEASPPAQQGSSCDNAGTLPLPEIVEYPSRQTTFPLLESLVIESACTEQDGYDDELRSFLASFRMPALRKCTLGTLVLCYATPTDDLPRSVHIAFTEMWGQLTHIDASFHTTLTDWRIFFGGLNSVESARITLTIVDSSDLEHESILPNLRELWIKINPGSSFGNVLDGFHLPALKTLLVRAPRLTLECFHRLLRGTRVLERIRLCSIFPTIDLEACFVKFPIPSERLKAHAPHLQQIMIDIPNIDQFDRSFREYVDGMVESGWLEGPWRSGKLRVEFFWICEPESMRRMIEDLQQYLGLRGFSDISGEVMITLRERVDEPQEESGDQLWDLWFDFGQEF